MSKKTLLLIIALVVLTIVLIIVAVKTKQPSKPVTTQNQTGQTVSPTPTPLAPGHTMLSLSPSSIAVANGTPSTVDVMIDTGGDDVRSVQLEIAYDPKALSNVTIKPGTFFSNPNVLPVGGVNEKTGRITFAVVPSSFRESKTGTGVVATVSFTPRLTTAASTTTISLLDKSLVSGLARGQNVLIKTSGAQVNLKASTQTSPTGSAR